MRTTHELIIGNAQKMDEVEEESIALVVTSCVYPIIELWDSLFVKLNPAIESALINNDGMLAFELMHKELDKIWDEVYRVLLPGGIACINIGDAVRTIGKDFRLYSNHARIIEHCTKLGLNVLPCILWKKPTNAPNKFMGSGMLPPGAYVTLEHEYVLIFRKGGKREFKTEKEKQNRRNSAFFWEERNKWFSDTWDLKGVSQVLKNTTTRERSAAFPFELAYRLINMFSVYGDTILDPFLGTGTTMTAAMASGRNSIGIEIEENFKETIVNKLKLAVDLSKKRIKERITTHLRFIENREKTVGELKYVNKHYKFPVMTNQEMQLYLPQVRKFTIVSDNLFEISYEDIPT
ncbi:modification methylase [Candidatus Heimdallarchaeota archaeon B3_Heim]|nr:MAG: modification methylase [Candidatus Heimdallarchaeota archaeon B3_Heim]